MDAHPSMELNFNFDPSPIDLVHLAKQCFGDRDLEREVLQIFVTQSETNLKRLEGADTVACAEIAHTIKGAARGVGAWHVAEEAESLEDCLREGRSIASAKRLLEVAVSDAAAFIKSLFRPG